MKILVCGGRTFSNVGFMFRWLDNFREEKAHERIIITHVIHGAARGADLYAGSWARTRGIQEVMCPANWEQHGSGAGPKRNLLMLDLKPDIIIAFPGGRGTAHMVRWAKEGNFSVIEVPNEDDPN